MFVREGLQTSSGVPLLFLSSGYLGLGNIGQGIVKALRKAGIEVTGTELELG